MSPDNNNPSACADNCGVLPSCAPLAVPYVPFQQTGSKKYNQADALNNGTLFPGLNLPFKAKVKANDVVNGPLAELQALEFVLVELGLYLDTHKNDKEALDLFNQYVEMYEAALQRMEERSGPRYMMSAGMSGTYRWTEGPWPWDYDANKEA